MSREKYSWISARLNQCRSPDNTRLGIEGRSEFAKLKIAENLATKKPRLHWFQESVWDAENFAEKNRFRWIWASVWAAEKSAEKQISSIERVTCCSRKCCQKKQISLIERVCMRSRKFCRNKKRFALISSHFTSSLYTHFQRKKGLRSLRSLRPSIRNLSFSILYYQSLQKL